MAETIRDVVIRLRVEQETVKIEPPNTDPIKKGLEDVEKATRKTTETAASGWQDVVEEARKLTRVHDQNIDKARKFGQESKEQSIKAAEGFKQAGEGAFTLARGIALISASGEEDLQRMLQTVAQIQGAFDLFKGSVDTIKGLSEGIKAMQAASAAAASQQAALATANAAVSTSATTAAGSLTALKLAAGPLGLALAGVAAAYLLLKNRDPTDQIDDVTNAVKKQNDALRENIAELSKKSQLERGRAGEDEAIQRQIDATLTAGGASRAIFNRIQEAKQQVTRFREGRRPLSTAASRQIEAANEERRVIQENLKNFQENVAFTDADRREAARRAAPKLAAIDERVAGIRLGEDAQGAIGAVGAQRRAIELQQELNRRNIQFRAAQQAENRQALVDAGATPERLAREDAAAAEVLEELSTTQQGQTRQMLETLQRLLQRQRDLEDAVREVSEDTGN